MQSFQKTNRWPSTILPDALLVFFKAQASAFTGGVIDYSIMIVLTAYGHIFYGYSILISGAIGAVVNFLINRYWTFKKTEAPGVAQLQKFIVMVIISILLKSSGTYLLTEWMHFDYRISRICIDALVSFGVNFTLQKYWVFSS